MKVKYWLIGLLLLFALLVFWNWPRLHYVYLAIKSKEDILTDLRMCVSNPGQANVYREINHNLKEDDDRVVFIGDSITFLWTGAPFNNPHFVNRGIGAQTTTQMLIRFRSDAIELKPKKIVLLGGINDIGVGLSLEDTESNITSMAELARLHNAQLVLCSVLPVNDRGHLPDGSVPNRTRNHTPEKIRALNEWMRKYAQENGLTYIDYYSEMVNSDGMLRPELSIDGLHLNAAGYSVMTEVFKRTGFLP
jgi:lysophospholipase L1-like esterase